MNTRTVRRVAPAMKLLLGANALFAISSCASDPGHFNGQKGPQRKSSGNARLEGPGAGDVIRDVHYDRARQDYEDRHERR